MEEAVQDNCGLLRQVNSYVLLVTSTKSTVRVDHKLDMCGVR